MCLSNVSCIYKKMLMNNPPSGIRGDSSGIHVPRVKHLLVTNWPPGVFILTYPFQRFPVAQCCQPRSDHLGYSWQVIKPNFCCHCFPLWLFKLDFGLKEKKTVFGVAEAENVLKNNQ